MAIIHDTTMTPGKLELQAAWLPAVVEPVLDGARRQLQVQVNRVLRVLATARAETP